MKKAILICAVAVLVVGIVIAQQVPTTPPTGQAPGAKAPAAKKAPLSPPAETAVTLNGKAINIKYAAPALRGRTNIFGPGGQISKDPTYPVWRAGANAATTLHTDTDLMIKKLAVPAGDYTLYVLINTTPWQLIINKQLKDPKNEQQPVGGTTYIDKQDLGRVPMDMKKSKTPIETYKMTLSGKGKSGKLQLEWENTIASVPFKVK